MSEDTCFALKIVSLALLFDGVVPNIFLTNHKSQNRAI